MSEQIQEQLSIYANLFTFMGRELTRDLTKADIVFMGIPYDMATTGRSGTRFGPNGVRRASGNLRWEEQRWPWDFALADRKRLIDYGDVDFEPGNSQDMVDKVVAEATKVMAAGKTLLSIGGDHFVTLPLLRAAHAVYGEMALVHFDAHTDTYKQGGEFDHGTMFARAPKEGLISEQHSIQIGIRTSYTKEEELFEIIDAAEANDLSAGSIGERIKRRIGDKPVYLTFDIDCLDPAYAPGTGTPVAGGLTSDHALKIIRELVGVNIVAMDVVEVAPAYDHADITSLAGATLALEMCNVLAADS